MNLMHKTVSKKLFFKLMGLFLYPYEGVKVIALHDLNYSSDVILQFLVFIHKKFNVAKIINNKVYFIESTKPKLLFTADDGFSDWVKFADTINELYPDMGIIYFIPSSLVTLSASEKAIFLKKVLHRKSSGLALLSINQIYELSNKRNVVIGSHGFYHEDFNKLSTNSYSSIIHSSIYHLEKLKLNNFNHKIFCLPYGSSDYFPKSFSLFNKCLREAHISIVFFFDRNIKSHEKNILYIPRCGLDPNLSCTEIIARLNLTRSIRENNFEDFLRSF